MPKEVAPVGADITPEIVDTVAQEIQRRIFALRAATELEVYYALKIFANGDLTRFIIDVLSQANEPMPQKELEAKYVDSQQWKSPFGPRNAYHRKMLERDSRLNVHIDGYVEHSRYPSNRLWTLASKDRPLKVIPSVTQVVQGWHFEAEKIARKSTGEVRNTLEACIGNYAAVPVSELGEDHYSVISEANRSLGSSNLQIHAHRGYALIGDDRPGYNLYFVDSEAMRTRLACNISNQ